MYRRRRLVVGLAALIILAGVVTGLVFGIRWLAVAQPWQNLPFLKDEPAAEEVAEPTPTLYPTSGPNAPDPSANPGAEEDEPVACENGALEVVAHTDKEEYGPDENPQVSMELTNVGGVDCVVNVGTKAQRFVIASGEDEWWRSSDCQVDPADQWVTLEAGQTVESSEPITWDRTRSYDNTCDAEERPAAVGGGATYTLTVKLGEVTSEGRTFVLQ